ncbi:MAG: D-2-hydroxyacid dehydrogenase [Cellulosilyticaceae bacterium]
MNIVVLDAKTLGDDIDLTVLNALGDVTTYQLTPEECVVERIKDADVILLNKVQLNAENLKDAKKLKIIALFATGYNNIDLEYAKKANIAVANVAGYSTDSVAQHTFAMLFNLCEQLSFYDKYVKSKEYADSETFGYIGRPFNEIKGKTWGIVAMGAIGQEVARLASAFGCRVIYYSTSGKNADQPYPSVDLETLLKESDILSIHAPLNERTKNLIGYEQISQMKKTAILMNLGRGGIIKEDDLARALKENLISGAALDVLEQEPIQANHPLYSVDKEKWFVTPHIAWASIEARKLLVDEVVKNVLAFFNEEERNRIV